MTFGGAQRRSLQVGSLVDNPGSLDKPHRACQLEKLGRDAVVAAWLELGVVAEAVGALAGTVVGRCSGQIGAHSAEHTSLSLGQKKFLFSPEQEHPLRSTDLSQGLAAPYAGSAGRSGDSLTLHGTVSLELGG